MQKQKPKCDICVIDDVCDKRPQIFKSQIKRSGKCPDIDIDFADRNIVLNKLKHRVSKLDTGKKHNTGVYFTEVPTIH